MLMLNFTVHSLGSHPLVVCFPPSVIQEESRQEITKGQWTQPPGPTARPQNPLPDSGLGCFQTAQKEIIQDPYTFCGISPIPDCEHQLYEALDSPRRGDRILEARDYCVLPSAGIMVKAIILFAPNSVSTSFIQLGCEPGDHQKPWHPPHPQEKGTRNNGLCPLTPRAPC